MVLSSVDISNEIAAGRLSFDPPVEDRIGASSIDLLLHGDLVIPPKDHEEGVIIAPGPKIDIMKFVTNNSESKSIADSFYQLDPHHFILGRTVERLCLPNYLAGRVEGKSSLARLGLSVHATAPTVQAGFRGYLVLEMYNAGPFTIQLTHKMEIAQLILERLETPPGQGYRGRFQNQGEEENDSAK